MINLIIKKNFRIWKKIRSDVIFRHLGITRKNIEFIDHSFGHAAYAYCSGLNNGKKSMVFTIDAWGDDVNYSCYKFHKIGQKIIAKKYHQEETL